jgi:hypothetical protein
MMGLPFFVISMIPGAITMGCNIAILILLIIVGRRLERPNIRAASYINIVWFVVSIALGILYTTLGIALEFNLVDAGIDHVLAIGIAYTIVVTSPSAALSIVFSVFLLRDALKNGLTPAFAIVAIVLIASNIGFIFVQIGMLLAGIDWNFGLPFGQAATIMWGVYFLVVRHSLAGPSPPASM